MTTPPVNLMTYTFSATDTGDELLKLAIAENLPGFPVLTLYKDNAYSCMGLYDASVFLVEHFDSDMLPLKDAQDLAKHRLDIIHSMLVEQNALKETVERYRTLYGELPPKKDDDAKVP